MLMIYGVWATTKDALKVLNVGGPRDLSPCQIRNTGGSIPDKRMYITDTVPCERLADEHMQHRHGRVAILLAIEISSRQQSNLRCWRTDLNGSDAAVARHQASRHPDSFHPIELSQHPRGPYDVNKA